MDKSIGNKTKALDFSKASPNPIQFLNNGKNMEPSLAGNNFVLSQPAMKMKMKTNNTGRSNSASRKRAAINFGGPPLKVSKQDLKIHNDTGSMKAITNHGAPMSFNFQPKVRTTKDEIVKNQGRENPSKPAILSFKTSSVPSDAKKVEGNLTNVEKVRPKHVEPRQMPQDRSHEPRQMPQDRSHEPTFVHKPNRDPPFHDRNKNEDCMNTRKLQMPQDISQTNENLAPSKIPKAHHSNFINQYDEHAGANDPLYGGGNMLDSNQVNVTLPKENKEIPHHNPKEEMQYMQMQGGDLEVFNFNVKELSSTYDHTAVLTSASDQMQGIHEWVENFKEVLIRRYTQRVESFASEIIDRLQNRCQQYEDILKILRDLGESNAALRHTLTSARNTRENFYQRVL